MALLWVVVLTLMWACVCLVPHVSAADHCETLSLGSLSPFVPPSVCASLVSYPIFVPSSTCQSSLEQPLSSLPTALWSLPPTCQAAVLAYTCSATYLPCSGTAPTATFPCRNMCDTVSSACASDMSTVSRLIPSYNCSALPAGPTGCNALPVPQPSSVPLPTCELYNGTACAGVLDPTALVYVPAGVTQTQMETLALSYRQNTFGAAATIAGCDVELPRFLCNRLFPTCATPSPPLPPLPRLINRTQCESFATSCADLITAVPGNALAVNCSSRGTVAPGRVTTCNGTVLDLGLPDFPINSVQMSASLPPIPTITYTFANGAALPNRTFPATGTCSVLQPISLSASGSPMGNVCAGVLDSPAFIPTGSCASSMEQSMQQLPTLLNQLSSPTCREALIQYVCVGTWQRCNPSTSQSTSALAAPCRPMCDAVNSACADPLSQIILKQVPGLVTNCSTLPTTMCQQAPGNKPVIPLPTCQVYSGQACAHILGNNTLVYIPAGINVTQLEAYAQQTLSRVFGSKASGCDLEFPRFICNRIFQSCASISVLGINTLLPRFVSKQQCDTYVTKCGGDLFPVLPQTYVNCSSQGVVAPGRLTTCQGAVIQPGLRDFPDSTTVFNPLLPAVPANNYELQTDAHVSASQVGRCEALNAGNLNPPSGGSVCRGVVNYPVYVASNSCQKSMDAPLYQLPTLFSQISNTLCRDALAAYACSNTYQKCDNATQSPPYPLQAPCASLCRATQTACSDPISQVLLSKADINLNCSALPEVGCNTGPLPTPITSTSTTQPNTNTNTTLTLTPNLPTCQSYPSTGVCATIIPAGSSIYVPAGLSLDVMEKYARGNAFVFALGTKATGCDVEIQRFLCNRIFNPCHPVTSQLGITSVFPRFISYARCMTYRDKCGALIAAKLQGTSLDPDCNSTGLVAPGRIQSCDGSIVTSPGLSDFPVAQTVFSTQLAPVPANDYLFDNGSLITVSAAPATCPSPLVIPDNPNADTIAGGACALPCRFVLFDDHVYTIADRLALGFVLLSFIPLTWLAATFLIFETKRKQRLVLMFILSEWFLTLFLLIHVGMKPSNGHLFELGCRNNSELKGWSDGGWIIFLATMFVFFEMSTTWYWMCSAVDICARVVFGFRSTPGSRQDKYLWGFYYGGGFIWAFTLAVVGLITHTFGAGDGGIAYSQFIQRDPKYPNILYGALYGPLLTNSLVGTTCMIATIVSLWHSAVKTGVHSSKSRSIKHLKQYRRPLAFIFLFLMVIAFICAYRFYFQAHEDSWRGVTSAWVTCLLSPGGSTETCGTVPPTGVSVGMFYLIHVAIFGQGFPVCLLFGTSMINLKLWAYSLGTALKIPWLVRFGKDATDAASGTSRTSKTDNKTREKSKKSTTRDLSAPPSAATSPRNMTSDYIDHARSPSTGNSVLVGGGIAGGAGGPHMRVASNSKMPRAESPMMKLDGGGIHPSSSQSSLQRHRQASSQGIVTGNLLMHEIGLEMAALSALDDRHHNVGTGQPGQVNRGLSPLQIPIPVGGGGSSSGAVGDMELDIDTNVPFGQVGHSGHSSVSQSSVSQGFVTPHPNTSTAASVPRASSKNWI